MDEDPAGHGPAPHRADRDLLADDGSRTRSGKAFVLGALALMAALVAVLVLVSPNLQNRMGIGPDPVGFPTPDEPVTQLLAGEDGWEAAATWDGAGACVVVTDTSGADFRTCADPDPLRPIWALDAPDADGPLLVVATTPQAAAVEVTTVGGARLDVTLQGTDPLPARFGVLRLPDAADPVDEVLVTGAAGEELVVASCGLDADGPDLLGGGCEIPD